MRVILALAVVVSLSGCNLLYRQEVQQGNLLDAEQIDGLKPGMTKRQVMLVLGTPAVQSPFHDDRWDYVSSYKNADGSVDLKRLTVVFDDNVLVRTEGDYEPGKGAEAKDGEPEAPKAEGEAKAEDDAKS